MTLTTCPPVSVSYLQKYFNKLVMVLLSVWLIFSYATYNCVITEGKSQEELEAEELEEEEEAKNIQKRLAANLSEEDYDLNFFQVFSKPLLST